MIQHGWSADGAPQRTASSASSLASASSSSAAAAAVGNPPTHPSPPPPPLIHGALLAGPPPSCFRRSSSMANVHQLLYTAPSGAECIIGGDDDDDGASGGDILLAGAGATNNTAAAGATNTAGNTGSARNSRSCTVAAGVSTALIYQEDAMLIAESVVAAGVISSPTPFDPAAAAAAEAESIASEFAASRLALAADANDNVSHLLARTRDSDIDYPEELGSRLDSLDFDEGPARAELLAENMNLGHQDQDQGQAQVQDDMDVDAELAPKQEQDLADTATKDSVCASQDDHPRDEVDGLERDAEASAPLFAAMVVDTSADAAVVEQASGENIDENVVIDEAMLQAEEIVASEEKRTRVRRNRLRYLSHNSVHHHLEVDEIEQRCARIPSPQLGMTHRELLDPRIHTPGADFTSFTDTERRDDHTTPLRVNPFRGGIRDDVLARWTPQERAEYERALKAHGKRFHVIAASIPGKTTQECVQFYYLMKHELGVWRCKQYMKKAQSEIDAYNKHVQGVAKFLNAELKRHRKRFMQLNDGKQRRRACAGLVGGY